MLAMLNVRLMFAVVAVAVSAGAVAVAAGVEVVTSGAVVATPVSREVDTINTTTASRAITAARMT